MAAVPPGWVFKVTIVEKPPTEPPIDRLKVARIEMPSAGKNEVKYINEDPEQTIKTIEYDLVSGKAAVYGTDYSQLGNMYLIYESHPNLREIRNLFYAGAVEQPLAPVETRRPGADGGSRRRRPSRKYKKSKRVLRRKSRSSRRR